MFEEWVGKSVGAYILLEIEKEDALGTHFWGRSVDLSHDAAILLVNAKAVDEEGFAGRFNEVVAAGRRLSHPGFGKILDAGQTTGISPVYYLVTSFLPGDSLGGLVSKLKEQGNWISLGESVRLVRQLALAMDFAGSANTWRRIDPHCVQFSPEDTERLPYTPVITDYGLEALLPSEERQKSGVSPAYLSPEAAIYAMHGGQAAAAQNGPSAVYSLGVLLFELATGQLPFPVTSLVDALRYHTRQPLPAPSSLRGDLPKGLEDVIVRSLQKAPSARYQTPGEMAEELSWTLPSLEGLLTPPPAFERVTSLFSLYNASLDPAKGAKRMPEKAQGVGSGGTLPLIPQAAVPASSPPPGPTPAPEADQAVEIELDQVQISVDPGRSVACGVSIYNPSQEEAHVVLGVEGAQAGWVAFMPRELILQPREQKTAQMTVKPARLPGTRAGRYPLKIRAVEKARRLKPGETSAILNVGAFELFQSELVISQIAEGETLRVMLTNLGNVPGTYTLSPRDAGGELTFEPRQSQVRLNPGQVGKADYEVALHRSRLFGGLNSHPFSVNISAASGEQQSVEGEFVSKSLLPAWVPIVLLVLCLCSTLSVLGYLGVTKWRQGSDQRADRAALTATVKAASSTGEAITRTAQFLISANQATLRAVTATAQAGVDSTATVQWMISSTAQAATQTASVQAATAQANATFAFQYTQTMSALTTQQAAVAATADSIARTATAQTGMLLTSTAQGMNAQTATAQSSLVRTATANAALIKTATANAALIQTATAQAATATAQALITPSPTLPGPRTLVYLYLTSTSLGKDYQKFLKNHGYTLDLVPLDALVTYDLRDYDAILVAPETGQDGTWGDNPGAWALKIANSGLPVIGLEEGGFNLFGKLGLHIGWPNGISTSTSQVIAVNPNDSVWKAPTAIQIGQDGVVSLYQRESEFYVCNIQNPPANVIPYGRWPANVNQYPLILEDGRYLLWGSGDTPNQMTQSGESLFLNFLDTLTK